MNVVKELNNMCDKIVGSNPKAKTDAEAIKYFTEKYEEGYVLPIASASTLGGVKVGENLSIDSETGVLSASGGTPTYLLAVSNYGGISDPTTITQLENICGIIDDEGAVNVLLKYGSGNEYALLSPMYLQKQVDGTDINYYFLFNSTGENIYISGSGQSWYCDHE